MTYQRQEHPDYPGYFIIPDERFKNYVVNRYGEVKQIVETKCKRIGSLIKITKVKNRYSKISIPISKKRRIFISVHILVCLAFHGPKPGPGYQVNHLSIIDGKANIDFNYYTMLRWDTADDNRKHANESGLLTNKTPLLVWDILNDPNRLKILHFKSFAECHLLIPSLRPSWISTRLKSDKKFHLLAKRYVVKRADDSEPWPSLNEVINKTKIKPVYAYNFITKKYAEAENIEKLGKLIGIHGVTIQNVLRRYPSIEYRGWIFSFHKTDALYKHEKDYYRLYSPLICFNEKLDKNLIYLSIEHLCKDIKLTRRIIEYKLKRGINSFDDYKIFYLYHDARKIDEYLKYRKR